MPARAEFASDVVEPIKVSTDFAALLRAVAEDDEDIPDHKTDPGAAFRFVYDGWVRRGRSERGKRRHSARQIKEWLKEDQVLSLETKLAGKTRLQLPDAFSLLRLFLLHWTYDAVGNVYTSYAPSDQLDDVTRQLLADLFPKDQKALLLPERGRRAEAANTADQDASKVSSFALELTIPTREALVDLFEQSDVQIVVGRARAVIGSDPPATMTAFHNLIEKLYQIDSEDRRKRSLIWIIDFGLRSDKASARAAIYNFYFMIAQFRAIALIERPGREEFYAWLLENACVIVGSLRHQEIDKVYGDAKIQLPNVPPDLMWFQSDRLFLESIPGRWIESKGSEAFGRRQRELWKIPTITAHLKLDDWPSDRLVAADSEVDVRRNLLYLFHAEVSPPPDDPKEPAVRCIPLPEPGSRWSDAYRMVVQAAFARLGRPFDERAGNIRPLDALAALRSQHFAVLRLREFLDLANTIVDQRNASLTAKAS